MIKETEPGLKTNLQIPVQRINQLLNRQGRKETLRFPPLHFFTPLFGYSYLNYKLFRSVIKEAEPILKTNFQIPMQLCGYSNLSYELFRSVLEEAEPILKTNLQIPLLRITQFLNRQGRL